MMNKEKYQVYNITLNFPYTLSADEWEKVSKVYGELDGWIDYLEYACWYGKESDERYIIASVEPSGLVLVGKIEEHLWIGWITMLCAKLSVALNREVYDAEM